MAVYPVRYRLPTKYSTDIGRIITRWAFLEWRLRDTAYTLLDISQPAGRLFVIEPRANEYLTRILDLMNLNKMKTGVDTVRLKKNLKELLEHRNNFAHGIWLKHTETNLPTLQIVKGEFPPLPGHKKVKAKIEPVSMAVPHQVLKNILKGIEWSTAQINRLRREIKEQLPPLQDKSS